MRRSIAESRRAVWNGHYTHGPAARRKRHCANFSVTWRRCVLYRVPARFPRRRHRHRLPREDPRRHVRHARLTLFLWQAERHADILATILARMSTRMSGCRCWCRRRRMRAHQLTYYYILNQTVHIVYCTCTAHVIVCSPLSFPPSCLYLCSFVCLGGQFNERMLLWQLFER